MGIESDSTEVYTPCMNVAITLRSLMQNRMNKLSSTPMMHRTKAGKLKFHGKKDCSQKITMTVWKQGSFSIRCHFCLRMSPAATSERCMSPTSLVLYDQPHVLDALKNLEEKQVSMFRQLNSILPGKRLGFRRS